MNGLDIFDLQVPINIPFTSLISELMSSTTDNGITKSSLLNVNVVSVTFFTGLLFFISYLLYPKFFTDIGIASYRSLGDLNFFAIEDLSSKVNKALNKFEIDSTTCMKVALCTLGKANFNNKLAKTKSYTTIDILDGVFRYTFIVIYKVIIQLNIKSIIFDSSLSLVNDLFVTKKDLSQARDFGKSGGDCNLLNRERKCPLDDQTWNLLLSSVNSAIF